MLTTLITFIIGGLIGFFFNVIAMKIGFKQRTIDFKIRVYDSIIVSWVKMRNKILSPSSAANKWIELDQIYGESQTFIGEAILVNVSST
jgi:hypothetical protein